MNMIAFISCFLLFSVVVVGACRWLAAVVHYVGWRNYDREFGTEYRFSEGLPNDWYFRMPPWMEQLLRAIELRVGKNLGGPLKNTGVGG